MSEKKLHELTDAEAKELGLVKSEYDGGCADSCGRTDIPIWRDPTGHYAFCVRCVLRKHRKFFLVLVVPLWVVEIVLTTFLVGFITSVVLWSLVALILALVIDIFPLGVNRRRWRKWKSRVVRPSDNERWLYPEEVIE